MSLYKKTLNNNKLLKKKLNRLNKNNNNQNLNLKPNLRRNQQLKITTQPVEPVEEPVVEEPVVEEPKKVDQLNEMVKCPDCNLLMTQHTLTYIHKRRGFCKADKVAEQVTEQIPEKKHTRQII